MGRSSSPSGARFTRTAPGWSSVRSGSSTSPASRSSTRSSASCGRSGSTAWCSTSASALPRLHGRADARAVAGPRRGRRDHVLRHPGSSDGPPDAGDGGGGGPLDVLATGRRPPNAVARSGATAAEGAAPTRRAACRASRAPRRARAGRRGADPAWARVARCRSGRRAGRRGRSRRRRAAEPALELDQRRARRDGAAGATHRGHRGRRPRGRPGAACRGRGDGGAATGPRTAISDEQDGGRRRTATGAAPRRRRPRPAAALRRRRGRARARAPAGLRPPPGWVAAASAAESLAAAPVGVVDRGDQRARGRGGRRRVERHPADAVEPRLDPRVRIAVAHHPLALAAAEAAGREAGGHARGDAAEAQQQRHRAGEVLAVARLASRTGSARAGPRPPRRAPGARRSGSRGRGRRRPGARTRTACGRRA